MITFIVVSSLPWQFINAFGLNKKVSHEGLFMGRGIKSILQHLYLDVYTDSKISCIMFVHDYHSPYEISTVRTLALKAKKAEKQ